MGAPRFASWAAVSSEAQAADDKISIEDQLKSNREHAARHGGVVVAELVVPGESRSIVLFEDAARRIPAYAQLKSLIESRAFDVLIFYRTSRLGRISSLSMAVVELCREANIVCYETDNPPATLDHLRNSGFDAAYLTALKSVTAQQEVRQMVENHRKGMVGRIKAGKMAGRTPFGYVVRHELVNAKLQPVYEIDETAAAVVRDIVAMYLTGRGLPAIAAELNRRGVPSPSGVAWSHIAVRTILGRAWIYAGYAVVNQRTRKDRPPRPYTRARGRWAPIITEAQAIDVEAEMQQRRNNNKLGTRYAHVLAGVCICGICGFAMHRTRQDGAQYIQLRCRQHKPMQTASYRRIVDELRGLLPILNEPGAIDGILGDVSATDHLNTQLARLQADLERIDVDLVRADDQYMARRMTADRYERQVDRLNQQRAQIESDIEAVQRQVAAQSQREEKRQRLQDAAAYAAAMLDSDDAQVANAYFRRLVRLVICDGHITDAIWL